MNNCEQCEKLRVELERVQKQFGVCSVCGYVAWKDMDARTEECQYCKLQKQAAAMREALAESVGFIKCTPYDEAIEQSASEVVSMSEDALKSGAGRDYVSKEQILPLVWALESYAGDTWDCEQANTALAHAHKLGFK